MTKEQFRQIIKSNVLLPAAIFTPEEDAFSSFTESMEAGANCLIAPTYLYETKKEKMEAIQKTVNAAQEKVFICGAVSEPKEKTIISGGKASFDAFYKVIKDEVSFLYENAPVSMLFLFGFESLAEAKYAVFAAREVCDLPVCVLLDFKDKTTLSDGFDITTSVITLQSLGISALGIMADDCDTTLDILLDMKEFASVPLFAVPGANDYITPQEYAEYAHDFVNNKCVMFCAGKGTDARFTAHIAKELWQLEPFLPDFPTVNAVCGKNQAYFMDFSGQVIGKNKTLIEIDMESMTKPEEADEIVKTLLKNGLPPVCFKTKDIEVLERAIKLYPARPAVRSDEYGEITAKEYGAVVLENKGE